MGSWAGLACWHAGWAALLLLAALPYRHTLACRARHRCRLHPDVADSVDQLLANKAGQLNAQIRTMRLLAVPGGRQQAGEQGPGKQVLVQFDSKRALLWAAKWVERGRRSQGGGSGVAGRTAAEVVADGGRGGLPGKWLLQLLQGALQRCALASSGLGVDTA